MKKKNRREISIELTRIVSNVISMNRKVVILPIVSFILIAGIFVLLSNVFFENTTKAIKQLSEEQLSNLNVTTSAGLSLLLLFFIILFILSISWFFNVALVISIDNIIEKKKPELLGSIKKSTDFLLTILGFALIETILYVLTLLILKRIKKKGGKDLRISILKYLGELTWGEAKLFVIPVMLNERLGALISIKRSVKILIKNFGKTFWSQFSVGVITWVPYLYAIVISILLVAPLVYLLGGVSTKFASILFLIPFIGAALYNNTLKTALTLVMYRYATKKKLPSDLKKRFVSIL